MKQNKMYIPVRIQRSRQHKQVSPNLLEIKYVGRGTKFGNPFKLIGDMIYIDAGHRRKILSKWVFLCMGDIEKCLRLYRSVVNGSLEYGEYGIELDNLHDILFWENHFKKVDLSELKGKNLSCWCSTDQCHATFLLKIANS